ncbi:MAG TPA: nucleotide-binding domain containing protein, partial [Methylomirabilota bacterium]
PPGRAWLWVVGSLHAASRAQLAALQAAGAAGVYLERVGDASAAAPDLSAVLRALDQGRPAFIANAPGAPLAPREASRALGQATARALAAAAPDVLAVTGGETAYAVLQSVGATRLDLLGAPSSGLALGALTIAGSPPPDGRVLPLLAKAGGFGAPDLFLTLLETRAA